MTVKAEYARSFVWAAELTEEELERAAAGIVERNYVKGAYVCHRDDVLDYWTGVVTGLIKLSTIGLTGKATTYAGVGNDGWFGEGSVLKGEPRKYDVVVLRDTRLAMMNRATFMWLYENSIGFNHYLLRQINERLGQFIAMVEQDRTLDAKARVARNLSWLFNPVLYPGTVGSVEITQDELALLAGVSRAVTNRSLHELQDEGLITVEHGTVSVHNVSALTRYGD